MSKLYAIKIEEANRNLLENLNPLINTVSRFYTDDQQYWTILEINEKGKIKDRKIRKEEELYDENGICKHDIHFLV